jgi:hypothetical protein
MSIDKRNKFEDVIFTYTKVKDNKVFIYFGSRLVKTLKDKNAEIFLGKIAHLYNRDAQLLMAKITGNFKRGNEHK